MASRAEILKQYGITDRPEIRIQTIQERSSPLWVVGVNGVGDPIVALASKKAVELSIALRQIGESEIADDISTAAAKAQNTNVPLRLKIVATSVTHIIKWRKQWRIRDDRIVWVNRG